MADQDTNTLVSASAQAVEPQSIEVPTLRLREDRPFAETGGPALRERPYFVRGRNAELVHLIAQIDNVPKVLQLVVGPPGAGKTAILEYTKEYARTVKGMRVVVLREQDFASDATLAARFDDGSRRTTSQSATISAEAGVKLPLAEASVATGLGEAETLAPDPNICNAIERTARNEFPAMLIAIDELHSIASARDEQIRQRLKALLQYMQTTVVEKPSGGQPIRAILIGVGTLETITALLRLKLTRIEPHQYIRLGPVQPSAARQVVEDHLATRTRDGHSLPRPPTPWWTDTIDSCEGFARHIASAAVIIQVQAVQLANAGRGQFGDADQQLVGEKIRQDRQQLYKQRWDSVKSSSETGATRLATAIAAAAPAWDNRIPLRAVNDIASAIARHQVNGADAIAQRATELIATLQDKGIIEKRDESDNFPNIEPGIRTSHWCLPIPSLGGYILETAREEGIEINAESDGFMAWLEPSSAQHREHYVQPWSWKSDPEPLSVDVPTAHPGADLELTKTSVLVESAPLVPSSSLWERLRSAWNTVRGK